MRLSSVSHWTFGQMLDEYMGGNLHSADFVMFYDNVRHNAIVRLAAWHAGESDP